MAVGSAHVDNAIANGNATYFVWLKAGDAAIGVDVYVGSSMLDVQAVFGSHAHRVTIAVGLCGGQCHSNCWQRAVLASNSCVGKSDLVSM